MTPSTNERPLLDHIDRCDRSDAQRRRETAKRCEAMEAALRDVGFAPGTSYWSVAVLLAKICTDWEPLERSLDKLSADREIACQSAVVANRKRVVRRALTELQAFGILRVESREGAKRRNTRPETMLTVTLNRAGILGQEPMENWVSDADNGADNQADKPRTIGGTTERTDPGQSGGQTPTLSLFIPLETQEPISPSPSEPCGETTTAKDLDSTLVADAVRSAGVERVRALINLAGQVGVSDDELVDAAFVVQHTTELTGGALFDWVRSGGWPVSQVDTADKIRKDRAEQAASIRRSVTEDAASSGVENQALINAVIGKRLQAKQLHEQMTDIESLALDDLRRHEAKKRGEAG